MASISTSTSSPNRRHLLAFSLAFSLAFLLPLMLIAGCYRNVFGAEYETCDELDAALATELSALQSCSVSADCGQVLEGTSCGCTNELVARKNADVARFRSLQARGDELECPGVAGECSCPAADGFVCTNGVCGWNYTP